MTIQDRLNKLKPYVIGMRFAQEYPIVDVMLKHSWTIPPSSDGTIAYTKSKEDENGIFYLFYPKDNGNTFDGILDYVENVIKINIDREQKNELLKYKKVELERFFEQHTLDQLNLLKFVIDEPISTTMVEEEPILENILPEGVSYDDIENTKEVVEEPKPKKTRKSSRSKKADDIVKEIEGVE